MIWLMTEIAEDGTERQSDSFLQVEPKILEKSVLSSPENEALLSRLVSPGTGAGPDEIGHLYEVFEEVWDRAQGSIAEGILREGGLPKDASLKARQLARDLRKILKNDPFMVALDEILGFLTLVHEGDGGITVVS